MTKDLLVFDFGVFWKMFLDKNQSPYPGRCYIEANRKDAHEVSDLFNEEKDILFSKIIPDWKKSICESYEINQYGIYIKSCEKPLRVHLNPEGDSSFSRYGIEFPTSDRLGIKVFEQISKDLKKYQRRIE